MTDRELIALAVEAMGNSYSPYSHFQVGAALETEDGTVFTGCNVECASYGATNCAERTAIFTAVSRGYRRFRRIAVVGGIHGEMEDYAAPCGICRQVMGEFCKGDFEIILARNGKENRSLEWKTMTLDELLPERFHLQ